MPLGKNGLVRSVLFVRSRAASVSAIDVPVSDRLIAGYDSNYSATSAI